jgi:membrane protease YdiL (CAAX protease family)
MVVWVASGAVMFVVSLAVATIAAAVAVATGVDPKLLADPRTSPVFTSALWVALGTAPVQLALVVSLIGAIWFLKPARVEVLPLGRPRFASLLGGVLVVFGLWPFAGVAAELVQRVLHTDLTASRIIVLAARDANLWELVLLHVTLAVMPAIGEESMFRGFITAPFLRGSRLAGIFVPAVLFGVFHLEPVQAAGTMVLGVGFGLARVYSGSVLPGALAHCLYNASVITLARLGVDSDEHAAPWWVFVAGSAVFAVGFALLVAAQRAQRDGPG